MKNNLFSISILLLSNAMCSWAYAHSLPLNSMAIEACQAKEKSQDCQYSGHHNDLYIGTCQLATETKLICVRNKPIQKIEDDMVKLEVNKKIENSNEHNQQMQTTQ
ncbi:MULTISPECIES: hypothetical protein [unclassified Oceanobacter]|uniref:hypothetical protein n=1 Tax=unclassified Oceanobacter TaxID=2620260 RepID=UPI0026E4445A|nr:MULTISPECIES: hypothetical protein [unclassified Oceanobacter]MDO6682633.1 hypothetical protein [Oceanobacter sp. 5_MG-2023]MDP2547840.1 hypothetical protein [Oceanobacter sp. 4_MG-2023]